ncbi:hypothetical protein AC231_12445 [Clostridium pasteurianum]|nr:hypothetical protein AQ983_19625 [Clostridium pasteurianum DSM 525 = ATCC 6013]AOZ80988.1 hypothetical protein AQ984_19620 [Clostridium pasteurianum]ELP59229.1 hypothetical protein F502_10123 [Clostridium pasteurianum DSM 525 = ATCC 6013]OMH21335.1 hypothetical protein AC231_12445 [Clostridium pasteurianum]
MDLSNLKGECWKNLNGEKKYLPLFTEKELKKAESIVETLEGMPIDSAKELLNKVSIAIEQLAVIR